MRSEYFNTVGEQLDVFSRMYNPSVTATSEDLRCRNTTPKNFTLPEIKVNNTLPSGVIMLYATSDNIVGSLKPVMAINIGDFV